MRSLSTVLSLAGATFTTAQYSLSGSLYNATSSEGQVVGNYYNYWTIANSSDELTYDLTRSDRLPVTSPKTLTNAFFGSRKSAIIEPSRTALVIIDMQNFFLDPQLSPKAQGGRDAVPATLNAINGFRAMGSKVLWTNWGLDNYDLATIPPSFLEGFARNENNVQGTTFGSDMGTITSSNDSTIEVGRTLMRGSWNAQPWGDLYPAMMEGVASGTDLYFNKSKFLLHASGGLGTYTFADRLSGLWGAQTPLGLYLQENEITTLAFGGVNADQCVWGTFLDAYYKGFDVIYLDDISQTVSPFSTREMTRYNADLDGFITNTTNLLTALGT